MWEHRRLNKRVSYLGSIGEHWGFPSLGSSKFDVPPDMTEREETTPKSAHMDRAKKHKRSHRLPRSFVDIFLVAITTLPAILWIAYHYRAQIYVIGAKLLQWFVSTGIIRGLPWKFSTIPFFPQINLFSKILPNSFNLANVSWMLPLILPIIVIAVILIWLLAPEDKHPNINRVGLKRLKQHLQNLPQLAQLDKDKKALLAQWIVKHRPWHSRDELRKALQGCGSGVKKHHQAAIADLPSHWEAIIYFKSDKIQRNTRKGD
jgi:hypothetical protein